MIQIFENARLQGWILIVLSLLLYSNTLTNGFVLDDDVVITRNVYVQKGFQGIPDLFLQDGLAGFERIGEQKSLLTGGRYRPLSLTVFAIIHSLFGSHPLPFHAVSILLFALVVYVLYTTLRRILKDVDQGLFISFLASLLFVVHPVHTEVVANIKSQDELFAVLFGLLSILFLIRGVDRNKLSLKLLSGVFLLLGCLAKENAITLLLVLPLTLYFFRTVSIKMVLLSCLPAAVGAVSFIVLRSLIVSEVTDLAFAHDPMNNPFLKWSGTEWISFSILEKAVVILITIWKYIQLLVFPVHLTHDYYPFTIIPNPKDLRAWIALAGLIALSVFMVKQFRYKKVWVYCTLFIVITISPTLNVFFPVGAFMAERFLFLPSIGFCLWASYYLISAFSKQTTRFRPVYLLVLCLPLIAGTYLRNRDWKSNATLMIADDKVSSKSARLQNNIGIMMLDSALVTKDENIHMMKLGQASAHLKQAIEVHPTYFDAYLAYGASSYYEGNYEQSVWAYQQAYILSPNDMKAKTGFAYALRAFAADQLKKGDETSAIKAWNGAYELLPDTATARQLMEVYGRRKEVDLQSEWSTKLKWMLQQ